MQQKHERLRGAIRFAPTLPPLQEVPNDAKWQYFTPQRLAETRDIVREWVKKDSEMVKRMSAMEDDCVPW